MAEAVGPYTIEMLERFPSDGKRYEIIDGALVVDIGALFAELPEPEE